ncbi:STAS domain-containing protein [Williamsia muralis]|uniref:STAS domain-containing protein n=1 Tax=Williamsia marianensis TaxID=85044 RepID=UPI003F165DAE
MSASETYFYPDFKDLPAAADLRSLCPRKITFSCTRAHPLVVRVDGEMDLDTVLLLRDYLEHLMPKSCALVVDLMGVGFAPVPCLELLIDMAETAAAEDRWFGVACERSVSRPLELLGDLVECFPSLEAARDATSMEWSRVDPR